MIVLSRSTLRLNVHFLRIVGTDAWADEEISTRVESLLTAMHSSDDLDHLREHEVSSGCPTRR
jgi:hypothetical protein